MTISGDAEAPIFDGLADTFNETVESGGTWSFDRIAGSWEDFSRKYITEIAAGSTHDVARIAIIHQPSYISNGYISDLTPFFDQSGISMDDYYESAFNEWRVDGKLYGIPAGIYNMAIYYNKTMFDELGIPHLPTDWEDESWNLDAFRETAAQLTAGDGAEKRYGFATNWDLRWVIHFVWAYGGDFVNAEHTQAIIDSPEAVQGLQFAQELIRTDESWLTPMQLSGGNTAEAFMTGRVGMYLDGMWQMPAMANIEDFEWGVAPVPMGTYRYTGNYVDAWVMPTGAKIPRSPGSSSSLWPVPMPRITSSATRRWACRFCARLSKNAAPISSSRCRRRNNRSGSMRPTTPIPSPSPRNGMNSMMR
ncbi:MAG: extracellular solute-binding protein [Caldilineaceae bacterium]